MSNNLIFLLIYRRNLILALKLIYSLMRLIVLIRIYVLVQILGILIGKLFIAIILVVIKIRELGWMNIIALGGWKIIIGN